ncbi:M55 family metallopeptidase [uncultured Clostridium sp.]|uniref:M55 family metallopeptidase n=1 Tax=uncultured Clostridium sp. TaxID=59620 RepID=UPI0032174652
MKIYISVDIEGISGVTNWGFTHEGGYNYERARRFMTEEVNAVIRGAKRAGAEEILVNDSHGPMTSILIEELDEDVVLISGNKKILGMMEGIDNTFDAVMLIGYHGRHNTSGILAHSYNGSVVSEIKLNGRVVGEFEFNSLVAGYFKVPIVMTSGDNILTCQAKEFNKNIETVEVKKAHSRYVGECVQPKRVHKMLESAAEKAINNKSVIPNILEGEVELEIAFMDSGMAEGTLCIPGVQLIAPNRIKYKAKDIIEAYKIRGGLLTLAGAWMQ